MMATVSAAVCDRERRAPGGITGAVSRSIVARLAHGIAWNALGGIVAQGGSFATMVALARILGKSAFGEFAMTQSTLVALTSLSSLALGITATKYVSEYRSRDPERAGRILGLCTLVTLAAALVLSLAVVILTPQLSVRREGVDTLASGLRLGAGYLFFTTMTGYQLGALAGFESFRAMAWIGVGTSVVNLTLSWIMAVRWGLPGAVLAQSVGATILWMLSQVVLRRECRLANVVVSYAGAWRHRSILLHFSMPAAGCGVVTAFAIWWCNAQLVRAHGYGDLAIFNAAGNMRALVLFVPTLIGRATLPVLNHLKASQRLADYRRTFWATVALNACIASVLAAGLALGGQKFLLLFGKAFVGSRSLVLLLLGAVVLEAVANILFQALFTEGRIWRNLGIIAVWAGVLVVCVLLTVRVHGAAGVALSYLCAWGVSAALYTLAAQCRIGREHVAS
jgi:O-antigen/teichoic acid export membrane protein